MKPERPPRRPYDPADPADVAALNGEESLVVLLASAEVVANGWAARAAVSLARRWALQGRRVLLADLGIRRTVLGASLGHAGGEGMTDLLLYGASLERVVRAAEGGIEFVPAGTPVHNGASLFQSPVWAGLPRRVERAGAQLVVLIASDDPGFESVLARAQRVVVLADPAEGEALLFGLGDAAGLVSVVLSPPDSSPVPPLPQSRGVGGEAIAGGDSAGPAKLSVQDAAPIDSAMPQPAADAAPPSAEAHLPSLLAGVGGAVAPEPSMPSSPAAGTFAAQGGTRGGRRLRTHLRLLVTALLLLLAGGYLLGRLGVLPLGFRTGTDASVEGAGGVDAAARAELEQAAPWGGSGAYFLSLGAYPQALVARLQTEVLAGRRPDILFLVSPILDDGEVLYLVLAGATDDATAGALRESLALTLSDEDPAAWTVRAAPASFLVARFANLGEARAHVAQLQSSDVPAFVLASADSSAAEPFVVWAGAYADSAESAYFRELLPSDEGLLPLLLRRTGALPQ